MIMSSYAPLRAADKARSWSKVWLDRPVLPNAALEAKDEPADERVAVDMVVLSVEEKMEDGEELECRLPVLVWWVG